MPSKVAARSGRTPKKGDGKTSGGWHKDDVVTGRLICDLEGAVVHPGQSFRGFLREAHTDAIPQNGPTQKHYVFLHAKTMEACQLHIDEKVVLSGATGKRVVCSAWPSPSLRLSDVSVWGPSLTSLSLCAQEAVTVCRMVDNVALAETITLRSSSPLPAAFNDIFKRCCSRLLDRRLFYLGNCVEMTYLGQCAVFSVDECVPHADGTATTTASAPSTPSLASDSVSSLASLASVRSCDAAPTTPAHNSAATPAHSTPTPAHSTPLSRGMLPGRTSTSVDSPFSSRPGSGGAGAGGAGAGGAGAGVGGGEQHSLSADMSALSLGSPGTGATDAADDDGSVTPATDMPDGPFLVLTDRTAFKFVSPGQPADHSQLKLDVTFGDVGGLEGQIRKLRDIIVDPMENPEIFEQLGESPGPGVILHGPKGTGKTLLIRALLAELDIPHVYISARSVMSLRSDNDDQLLSEEFAKARSYPRSILVIEDLDKLCPASTPETSDSQRTTSFKIESLLDELTQRSDVSVMIVATAVHVDAVCPAMRSDERLPLSIEVTAPTAQERAQILEIMLRKLSHSLSPEDISRLASRAHGYVGGDLRVVCKEACLNYIRRRRESPSIAVCMIAGDFEHGLNAIPPSAMMGISIEVPKVKWSDIGGLSDIKDELGLMIECQVNSERYEKLGFQRPRGALLYGPPGCSKTMIARAMATESGMNFLSVKGPELFSKFVGESERAVREVFRRARAASPSIVFFDEIDALGVKRDAHGHSRVGDRVVTQLLTEMDGVERLGDVIIIAATNRPDAMDEALLRPGRFDSCLYVPLPNAEGRKEIFSIRFQKTVVSDDVDLDHLASCSVGYSGAEIVNVVNEAIKTAVKARMDSVTASHLDSALKQVLARTTPEQIRMYEQYTRSGRAKP